MHDGFTGVDRAWPPKRGRHPCRRWITSRPAHVAAVPGQFPGAGLTSQARGAKQARAISIFAGRAAGHVQDLPLACRLAGAG